MLDVADLTGARQHMVTQQVEQRGVHDPAVLVAMREVRRLTRSSFQLADLASRRRRRPVWPPPSPGAASPPAVRISMLRSCVALVPPNFRNRGTVRCSNVRDLTPNTDYPLSQTPL